VDYWIDGTLPTEINVWLDDPTHNSGRENIFSVNKKKVKNVKI
jgi:hypothetical protein